MRFTLAAVRGTLVRMETLWRIVVGVGAVWLLVAGGLLLLRNSSSTPEKLQAYLEANPLESLPPERRAKVLSETARMLNVLSYEQRQQLRKESLIRNFVKQLTPDERASFFSRTIPSGVRQLVAELNRMEPLERKRLVQRLLRKVKDNSATAANLLGEEEIQEIGAKGFEAFYRGAKPAVREDFLPLMEEIDRASKGMQ